MELYALVAEEHRHKVSCVEGIAEALAAAEKLAGPGELVVVGGSLYLIGDVRRLLVGELC
jgi:dihydrofolate synthase/folylpolyglutamate synthase